MAILDTPADRRIRVRVVRPVPQQGRVVGGSQRSRRPALGRPGGAALQYRGTGVLMSRASHQRRPITPVTTVLLALVAGAITLWLGLVAQLGGVVAPAAPVSSEVAVVQVQSGETLHQLARRVVPDAPVAQAVQQIRDLNQLESAAVDPGQTLLAPIG